LCLTGIYIRNNKKTLIISVFLDHSPSAVKVRIYIVRCRGWCFDAGVNKSNLIWWMIFKRCLIRLLFSVGFYVVYLYIGISSCSFDALFFMCQCYYIFLGFSIIKWHLHPWVVPYFFDCWPLFWVTAKYSDQEVFELLWEVLASRGPPVLLKLIID
jgi:hypothetical protein